MLSKRHALKFSLALFVSFVVSCQTSGAIKTTKVENVNPETWSYRLDPIKPATPNADGSFRTWHSRFSQERYRTEQNCNDAANKALDYLAGEAWNMRAVCSMNHERAVAIDIDVITQ